MGMKTPWDMACEIPSAHGLAADVFAHLCGEPGAYCLSTPQFLILACPCWLTLPLDDMQIDELRDPFRRWPESNCWRLGVVAGDAIAAYHALVETGGHKDLICWESANGIKVRRSDTSFLRYLRKLHGQILAKQQCSDPVAAAKPRGVEGPEQGDAGPAPTAGGPGKDLAVAQAGSADAAAAEYRC